MDEMKVKWKNWHRLINTIVWMWIEYASFFYFFFWRHSYAKNVEEHFLVQVDQISKPDNEAINQTAATCKLCNENAVIEHIKIPYIFKYLVA